jgi:hypothetical protein
MQPLPPLEAPNRANEVEGSFVQQARETAIIAKGHRIIVKYCE